MALCGRICGFVLLFFFSHFVIHFVSHRLICLLDVKVNCVVRCSLQMVWKMKDVVCGKLVFFSISSIQKEFRYNMCKCHPTKCANHQMNEWHVLPITQFRSVRRWTDSLNIGYSLFGMRRIIYESNDLWSFVCLLRCSIWMRSMLHSTFQSVQTISNKDISHNKFYFQHLETKRILLIDTNPCRQMGKHKQEYGEINEDNFTMEWKWLELQIVWCDKVSIPMIVHPDMLIFFKQMKSRI